MDMYLKVGEDVSKIDVTEDGKPIRNRWQWSWLGEISDDGFSFETWCKKTRRSGVCACTVCGKSIVYGSSGKKALKKHANLEDHKKAVKSLSNATKLAGASITTSLTKDGIQDQINENKSVISLFIAEHCLPFSLAPELLKLAQRLNNPALSSTTMSRQSATYNISHGVGHSVRGDLGEKLKGRFFSLNVDEATNNAGNKFLNVIVQYFDEDGGTVRNQLLGTREVNISTAVNITAAIEDILFKMGLEWQQVVSVTMDNCNVMRGKKQGVEAKIRELNPNLLDVSGDTIHMVNNAVKKFFIPIDSFFNVQTLASDVFYDIEDSPKVRCLFGQIQSLLFQKKSSRAIIRPIPNRFLQMNTVAERFIQLWDAIWVYYSGFLSVEERKKYAGQVKAVLDRLEVSEENRSQLWKILEHQRKQAKTDANMDRKDRILSALFHNKDKTLLLLNLYRGITEKFLYFSKKYQASKPLMHELHGDLFMMTKEFLAGFMIPEAIPEFSVKQLLELDLDNKSNQLKDRELGVWMYSTPILHICLKDKGKNSSWLKEFFTALRQAYVMTAEALMKLPLSNSTLTGLAYLSPGLQRNSKTVAALSSLAKKLTNVLTSAELGQLDEQVRDYSVDDTLSMMPVDEEDSNFRLDRDWLVHIMNRKVGGQLKYPVFSKLLKAVLTVFTGPLVESSFNIMDDILEDDRTRLTTYNFESLAMIKSSLSAHGEKAVTMKISQKMKHAVYNSYSKYEQFLHQDNESSLKELKKSTPTTTLSTPNPSPHPSNPSSSPSISSPNPETSEVPSTSQLVQSMKRKQAPLMDFFKKKPKLA